MNDTRARNPLNQHSSDDTARTMNPTTYHPPSLSLGTPAGISPLKLNFSYPIPIPTPAMRVPPPPRQQPALPNGMEYARALTGLSTLPIREYWELRREVDLESLVKQLQGTQTQVPANDTRENGVATTARTEEINRANLATAASEKRHHSPTLDGRAEGQRATIRTASASSSKSLRKTKAKKTTSIKNGSGSAWDPIILEDDAVEMSTPANCAPLPQAEVETPEHPQAGPSSVNPEASPPAPPDANQTQSQNTITVTSTTSSDKPGQLKLRITRSRTKAAINSPTINANPAPTTTKTLLPRHTRKLLNLQHKMGWYRSFGSHELAYPHEVNDPHIGDIYLHVHPPNAHGSHPRAEVVGVGTSYVPPDSRDKTQVWVRRQKRGIVQWVRAKPNKDRHPLSELDGRFLVLDGRGEPNWITCSTLFGNPYWSWLYVEGTT